MSAAELNFVSVHSHMLGCKYIPDGMKVELTMLKALRREQTSRLKTGLHKVFFTRVWARFRGTLVPSTLFGVKQLAASLENNAKVGSKLAKKIHHPKGNGHGNVLLLCAVEPSASRTVPGIVSPLLPSS